MTRLKKYRIAIAVLSALLSLSLVLLVVQLVRRLRLSSDEVTLRNNSIGAAEQIWEFGADGMLPGDSQSKTYTVKLTHEEALTMAFTVRAAGDAALLDSLLLTVTNTASGETVCADSLREATGKIYRESIAYSGSKNERLPYSITVTLDPAAGNAAQNTSLTLSFHWSILSAEGEEGGAR